jgi:hypothetical protein
VMGKCNAFLVGGAAVGLVYFFAIKFGTYCRLFELPIVPFSKASVSNSRCGTIIVRPSLKSLRLRQLDD